MKRISGVHASLRSGVALLAAAFLALPVGAQRISGTISMPGGSRSVGGLLVVARDAQGADIVRAVTSEDGRYAVVLPRPGAVTIVVRRVGFDDAVILDREIAAGEVVVLDAPASGTHRLLPARGAASPSSCGADRSGREYVNTLLDEARKAFLAMQLGLSRSGVSARWTSVSYRIAQNGRDTARYELTRRAGGLLGAFGNPVLAELQRSGFVVSAGTDRIFRGLDIPALLSPWFEESYCFSAVEVSGAVLSLRFEPRTRKRDYVDIAGTLNLVKATLEPTGIDYVYVGLPADEDKREAGGQISFARTAGGSWLITDWMLRFPQIGLVELETFRPQDRARLLQPEVMGHELIGGHTTALLEGTRRTFDGSVAGVTLPPALRAACHEAVLASPTGAAQGRLTYEGRPVSGSRIRATWRVGVDIGGEVPLWRDESRETTTSNRGEWVLCDLPANLTVELSWEVLGRKSTAPLRVAAGAVVEVGPDGRVIER